MKYLYVILSGLLLTCWIIFGNYPGPAGLPVPALGQFFNPAAGFWHNTRPGGALRRGATAPPLDHPLAKGSIHFDERGVPHIFAPDLAGACFLQGYANAADRLWQMDISTRATEGRLSEILGTRTLSRDRSQIRRGFRQAARREIDTMQLYFPEELQLLEAYAEGINAWIDQLAPGDYPVEYKLLDHQPLRWSPYRTALLMKGMSQALSGRYSDVEAAHTRAELGPDVFDALYPERFPGDSPIVPDEGKYPEAVKTLPPKPFPAPASAPKMIGPFGNSLSQFSADEAGVDQPYTLLPAHPGNGSNNWAVAARMSNTGHPMLASDPHLALTLPSIWAEVQIHYPGVNARGVSLPGAPGIMIGFNDHIAYGETNVGHDVTDWFRITWTDTTRTTYLLDDKPVNARIITDTIRIKGREREIVRTPWTVFGPVPHTDGPYADHAMRYLGHDAPGKNVRPHSSASVFLHLMAANDYADYAAALKSWIDPAQNFIFASERDEIAIRPNGGLPLRAPGQTGRFPTPGNTAANNWRGYIPFPDRPEQRNPARGFVASANQVTTGPNYPYPYFGSFDEYRGRLINRSLARKSKMTQREMKELQLSSYSLLAEELTPILIARINRASLSDEGRRLLKIVSEWNYRFEGDSRAATLFEDWRTRVYRLTFDEMPQNSGLIQPEIWKWNELLGQSPSHAIFDVVATTDFRETATTLTQRAFDEMLEELDGNLPVPWAESRGSRVRHLGAVPGFGSGLITTGGSRFSPRALSAGHGASWRMVVELGDTPRAWGTLPGGPSGDPASKFYDSGLDDWENGRYHELVRWKDEEEAGRKSTGSWVFK